MFFQHIGSLPIEKILSVEIGVFIPKTMLLDFNVGSIDSDGTYPIKNTVLNKIKTPIKTITGIRQNIIRFFNPALLFV